ncbi:RIP metalloprotease RseP [Helicobacter sp. 12S02634-8]|uniref:RIP metalloprotease RseP n=1 Tax=Helicobacter sp. 12S02634-8 TaxID=1476199 RepID=UPI000BA6C610|nr:RIP metalloprotease RseP [Helicobacter sp. 12S02634-8]PAF46642.1 RIP metalloprotease RseP [Helicobacter sp. 12S02634-8]
MWIVIAILILSFLIFFHELGHFLVARAFGVRVEVFSIGFGKKLLCKTFGQTQYAISSIPLGGYVKLKGQDDTDPLAYSQDTDSYSAKAPWKRICILLAGPGFNFLLALCIYMGVALVGQKMVLPVIGELQAHMPASESGLQYDDRIVSVNGTQVHNWQDLSLAIMQAKEAVRIEFVRDGKELQTTIYPKKMPAKNIFGENIERNFIGIVAKGEVGVVSYGFKDALKYAILKTYDGSKLILESVEKILVGVVSVSEVGGVVSIVDFIAQAGQSGVMTLFVLVALISINLGVLNLLPIPALDGGQILFNLYAILTRKQLSQTSQYYLTIVGWALLMGLMALGLYNDIHRLVVGS